MKVGITFGGYAPLHQGHLDLIMRAKKENDIAFVVVCGYNGEKRTEDLRLNLITKTRLVKQFLEDNTLKVFSIDDTELGLDESMCQRNWDIWCNAVMENIGSFAKDNEITFYIGEKSYAEHIKTSFRWTTWKYNSTIKVELIDRNKNFVSGTECRKNPLKYWNKIALPYRDLFSHNILISGTSSEGKTTLVEDISKYFGIVHSYEKGRDNCHWKTDKEFTVQDFIYNLYEQRRYNDELIKSPANTGVFISDTDNIVTLMYAWGYAQKEDFVLTQEDYETLFKIAKVYQKSTRWDKIFLLKPHKKPIVDDGERYMGDSDYKIRKEYFEKLKSLYDEFGYEYEILDGNYYDNFLRVKNYIGGLYEQN